MRRAAGPLALFVLAVGLSLAEAEALVRWQAPAALRPAPWPCVYEPDPRFGFRYRPDMMGPWQRLVYRLARRRMGAYPPYSGLCYVWADRAQPGRIIPSPHYERAVMVVVRSGEAHAGRWLEEERDILADYLAAFGTPPPEISHLAVMTDGDDTGSTAEAWYAGLELRRP